MSNSICLVLTDKSLSNLKSVLGNYPRYKVDVIEERYSVSGIGLSDDLLVRQFDTIQEIILSNAHMVIADRSILSFTTLIDSSPMIFNYHHTDESRIYAGNNIFINVL